MERSGARGALALLAGSTAGVVLLASAAHLHPGGVVDGGGTPSPVLPILPVGHGPPSPLARLARAIGLNQPDPVWATVLALALVAAAGIGFLLAMRAAADGRLSARAAMGWTLGLVAAVVVLPPLLSRDVYSYAIYGRIWAVHGANPYVAVPAAFPDDPFRAVISAEWVREPSVYGPAFTLLSGAIARLFASASAATSAFKVVAALAVIASARIAMRVGERDGPERAALAVVLVGLNPAVLYQAAGGAHNDVLVGLAIVGALALWLGGHRLWATVVLTLGAQVKVVAAIPLALAMLLAVRDRPGQRLRTLAAHAGIAGAITVALFIPFGLSGETLGAFAGLASRQGWAAPARVVATAAEALGRALSGEGLADTLAGVVRVVFLGVFVVAFVVLARRAWNRRIGPPDDWTWALVLFALAAAYLLPWYVAWFAPLLGLTSDKALRYAGAGLSAALALTAIPPEPAFDAALWSGAIDAVHWVAGPLALILFVALLVRLARARSPAD